MATSTFWEYISINPIISLLQPWASKVWVRAKENNSPYNNTVALQSFINNATRSGKYSVTDIHNIISAYKLVRNQFPSISPNTADFTTKMIEIAPNISKIPRMDIAAIRALVVGSIYPSDGTLYNWLNGTDSDGVIAKAKAVFEKANYDTNKTSTIVSDKVTTVAEGVNSDLQKYLKYATIGFASYVILQTVGLLSTLSKK